METIIAAIVPAIITGSITLLGVVIANNKKDAVMEERMNELTREVRKHNNFAERIPTIEAEIKSIEQIIDIYHNGGH